MPIFVDARIPVLFAAAAAAGPDDALLVAGDAPDVLVAADGPGATGHAAGCTCCTPRGAVAAALSRLFLARARGETPFFRRVVVAAGPEAETLVRAALDRDAFLAGRYRLAP
jgi:G3E family GTPase